MSSSDLSAVEAIHTNFFYFAEGLNLMASDAPRQRAAVGGDHVAWELQNDVRDFGEAVLRNPGPFIADSDRAEIASLLTRIGTLPADALRSGDEALDHPEWEVLRGDAKRLLARLARPIAENLAFFKNSPPTRA